MELLVNALPVNAATLSEWQDVEFACVPPHSAHGAIALQLTLNNQVLEPFLRPGDSTWRWRWNPENSVGHFTLNLRAVWPDGHSEDLQVALEVLPRKIDQQRYDLLLADLQGVARTLVYTLVGGAADAALRPSQSFQERDILDEYFSLFGERFEAFERAVERIAQRPHMVLRATTEHVQPGLARDLSQVEADLARGVFDYRLPVTDPLPSTDGRDTDAPVIAYQLPSEVAQSRSTPTTDTYENRVLKRLLDELLQRARFMVALASRELQDARAGSGRASTRRSPGFSLQGMVDRSSAIVRRLQEVRSRSFLAEVTPLTRFHGPSQVMQRDPAYRQIYRFWQDLRRLPFVALDSPLFHVPVRDVPRLYEYWCTVQVVWALLELPGIVVRAQCLVTQDQREAKTAFTSAYTCTLVEDTPLLVLDWRGMTLHLRYQPPYRPRRKAPSASRKEQSSASEARMATADAGALPLGSSLISLDRHTRIPDLALELEQPGQPPTVIVFDAKYRLDASGGVPEDALADAYTYLGSIGTASGERVVRAAVLLYPGRGAAEHYASGVGALPLLPGATGALQEWLKAVLQERVRAEF